MFCGWGEKKTLTCNGVSGSFSLLVGQICFNAIIASLQNFSPITSSSSRPYLVSVCTVDYEKFILILGISEAEQWIRSLLMNMYGHKRE